MREREVLLLVAEGLTDKEIAEQLSLSVRTVQFHVMNMRNKAGVNTRAKVVNLYRVHALREAA